ncbi:MAG TPA: YcxB family protein [Acidimicrobiales bacterium]|nr:YcxB family protein [Acidimicrobiales bacterium]
MVTFELAVARGEVMRAAMVRMFRRWPARSIAAAGIALVLVALGLLVARGDDGGFTFLGGVVLAYLAVVVVLAAMRSWRTTLLRHPGTVELSADGIHFFNNNMDSRASWTVYPLVVETSQTFIAMTGQGFLPLPKRCFASTEDVARVRELIRTHSRLADHVLW